MLSIHDLSHFPGPMLYEFDIRTLRLICSCNGNKVHMLRLYRDEG